MTTKEFQERSLLRIFLSYFKPHRRLFRKDSHRAIQPNSALSNGTTDLKERIAAGTGNRSRNQEAACSAAS